jgi:hypothetical protein
MEGGESIRSNPKQNTQRNITSVPVNRNTNNNQAQVTIVEPQDTRIPPQQGRDIHRTQTCYDGNIRLYSEAVDSSKLCRSEASLAYNTFYMKSIGYGTSATSLSYQDCDNMQKPVVNSKFPKMGISRKSARAVMFGTFQHGGLGLDHLATFQLYGQLQYLIGSIRCNDMTGQLARMMLEFAKLECGCIGNVFEQNYEGYHGTIIAKNWIKEIWSYVQLYDSKIQINGLWTPKSGREGDTSIMERITAPEIFTTRELQEINRCRLYLQVFFLSDITDHS